MKKIITSALVAATTVAALSACSSVGTTGNPAGNTHPAATTANKPKAPAIGTKAKAPAAPKYTVAQQQAMQSAQSYLDMSGFSRAGLIQQLTSKAGEGFEMADAVFAVNHIKVDWSKEAVESAKSYLEMGGFSRAGLIEQLSSPAGDQFTVAQATYAADHVGL